MAGELGTAPWWAVSAPWRSLVILGHSNVEELPRSVFSLTGLPSSHQGPVCFPRLSQPVAPPKAPAGAWQGRYLWVSLFSQTHMLPFAHQMESYKKVQCGFYLIIKYFFTCQGKFTIYRKPMRNSLQSESFFFCRVPDLSCTTGEFHRDSFFKQTRPLVKPACLALNRFLTRAGAVAETTTRGQYAAIP